MLFTHLAQVFDQIDNVSSRIEKTKLLAHLLAECSAQEAKIVAYLSLGSLHAPFHGTRFNIAEKIMIAVLAHALDISVKAVADSAQKQGDMGLVFVHFAGDRELSSLSIEQVYHALCSLEEVEGTGSQEQKTVQLTELLKHLDAQSGLYVIRVIMGRLRLGFSDMTLIDAFSWMETGNKSISKIIEKAYNACADIGQLIHVIKHNGVKHLDTLVVTPGIPLRPAAAERMASPAAIYEKLGNCVAQPKLDGFRLQVHRYHRDGKVVVSFFSRNLQEKADSFPELTKALLHMDHVGNSRVGDFIAEGEAICYDAATDTFLPYQDTAKRSRKHDVAENAEKYPLKIFLFDLLYFNGKSLIDESHAERRNKLVQAFGHADDSYFAKATKDTPIQVIEQRACTSTQDIQDYFDKAMSEGLEGLVVKKPSDPYAAGKRNFSWIKLKRHETGSLDDTIDCVILGYYFGRGKRAGGIGALLVGIYNVHKDQYETIAKLGTGMTDQEFIEVKAACDKASVDEQPDNVVCHKDLYPDVWTNPQLVCIVRADEITKSPVHTACKDAHNSGFALRFPRYLGLRDDKSVNDATSDHEIKELFKLQFAHKK